MIRLINSILMEIKENKFLNKKLIIGLTFVVFTYLMAPKVTAILRMVGINVPNYVADAIAAAGSAGTVYKALAEIFVWTVPSWVLWAIVATGSAAA